VPARDASSDAQGTPPDASPDAAPAGPDAGSGTVTFRQGNNGYVGTVDTYISSEMPTTALGDLEYVHWEDDSSEYGLLRFDNIFGQATTQIPLGSSIVQASLTIVISDDSEQAGNLREAAVDWDETVTFNSFGTAAGVQGGDMHPETIASVPKELGTHVLDVTASIARWSSQSRVNRGWVVVSTNINDSKFRSSEYVLTATERPELTVEYAWP
jgi:hypothetical protein